MEWVIVIVAADILTLWLTFRINYYWYDDPDLGWE